MNTQLSHLVLSIFWWQHPFASCYDALDASCARHPAWWDRQRQADGRLWDPRPNFLVLHRFYVILALHHPIGKKQAMQTILMKRSTWEWCLHSKYQCQGVVLSLKFIGWSPQGSATHVRCISILFQ